MSEENAPNPTFIPLSITSNITGGPASFNELYIGQGSNLKIYHPSAKLNDTDSYYWFVAIDRQSLKIVHEVTTTSNTDVPSGFETGGQYNNDDHILVFSTTHMSTLMVPQSDLYAFLRESGAGLKLARLEQVFLQLNCGTYGRMAYSLVDTMGTPGAGFEESSFRHTTVSTLTLLGEEVNGNMLYTPISLHA